MEFAHEYAKLKEDVSKILGRIPFDHKSSKEYEDRVEEALGDIRSECRTYREKVMGYDEVHRSHQSVVKAALKRMAESC